MVKYVLRRFGSSLLVMFGASVLMFVLVINAGDPLKDLQESTSSNREQLIQQRIETMGLDQPWYIRYWEWLRGVSGCVTFNCDFGTNRMGQPMNDVLTQAAVTTLRLVFLATILAIVIGVGIGIVTAIRQYSGLDYAVTFLAFLFFSLPVFWAAVLLKEYMAIGFNNWIAEPEYALSTTVLVALIAALIMQSIFGGSIRRRGLTAITTIITVIAGIFIAQVMDFARHPQLGPAVIFIAGLLVAVMSTVLLAGMRNRRVLYTGIATAIAGLGAYYATFWILDNPQWLRIFLLAVSAVAVGILFGFCIGGDSRIIAAVVGTITALGMGLLMLVDKMFLYWPIYVDRVKRPIGTIGSETPNFTGSFWEEFLDKGTQLLLPTILLTLISVATYSRYTRSSMLDVTKQDYIRTARAKGLTERQVIVKHAFRNSLIPITTIMAFDFAGLIGGAVITERVFGWKGMGALFASGLDAVDPAPVMGFFLVTATAAILFNFLADILYALLDPRIRVS